MSKEFVWTDALVIEYGLQVKSKIDIEKDMAAFKESKTTVLEFEIMSMMHESNREDRLTIFERQQDGRFKAEWWPDESFGLHDDLINNKNGKTYLIRSVKRMSDGEVFTIGDQITSDCCTNWHKIFSFRIIEGTMCADFDTFHSCTKPLHKIEKVKANVPLFTTEDGVKIFDKETKVFVIDPRSFERWNIYAHAYDGGGHLCFSTKESVEEYVINNKPCLSIEDVAAAGFECSGLRKELKELVKKKLSSV